MMRRIKVFLALFAIMVPMLGAFAGPAMAIQCDPAGQGALECGPNDTLFLPAEGFGTFDTFGDGCIGVISGFDCIGVDTGFEDFVDSNGLDNALGFDNGNLNDNCDFIGFDENGDPLFAC